MGIFKKIIAGRKIKIELSRKDKIKEILVYTFLALILYMFFHSIYLLFALPVLIYFYHGYFKIKLMKQKKEKINLQFKDSIKALAAALRAGKSVENALKESLKEMLILYGPEEPICKELIIMVNQVSLGIPIESVFNDFSNRTQVEDIKTFASVFQIAKRTGGNMVEIVNNTAESIADKIDTRNEIAVVISSKKLEQKIMSFMPLGILFYIQLTSPDMLSPLYGNVKGVMVMILCLLIYGGAYYLSTKIMNIEV